MSEIPADVIQAAREALGETWSAELGGTKGWLVRRDNIARAIMAERERCAAFAFAKHDWPARWIASSFRGENSAYHDFERHLEAEPQAPEKVT